MQRNTGLDSLKAISIVFVLLWHLKPVQLIERADAFIFPSWLFNGINFFYLQISLTAVPVLLIVSLYLLFSKLKENEDYIYRRLARLTKLFIFWTTIQVLFCAIFNRQSFSGLSWKLVLVGIKPDLPYVGDSVFYFLFILLLLTILSFFYQKLNAAIQAVLCPVIFLASLAYFQLSASTNQIPYYALTNFLLYVPVAFLLFTAQEQLFRYKYVYLIGFLLFSTFDTQLLATDVALNLYGRVSIVFGVLSLVCFVYPLKLGQNNVTQLLANYSLGLFALHKYWQYLFLTATESYILAFNITEIRALYWSDLLVVLLTLLFTCLSIYLLRYTSIKQFTA
jgi:hypothetical protein